MSQNDINSAPLVRRIKRELSKRSLNGCVVRVSVADKPQWERSSSGDEVLVRWLCWSIDDGESEIVPPEFEVVGKDVSFQKLKNDLPLVFREVKVVVDNDIDV